MLLLLGNPAQASYHLRSSPSLAALWILSVHEKKKIKRENKREEILLTGMAKRITNSSKHPWVAWKLPYDE